MTSAEGPSRDLRVALAARAEQRATAEQRLARARARVEACRAACHAIDARIADSSNEQRALVQPNADARANNASTAALIFLSNNAAAHLVALREESNAAVRELAAARAACAEAERDAARARAEERAVERALERRVAAARRAAAQRAEDG